MNEWLEQLVRVLTNACSRSQRMSGERVSPGPANQRSFLCLPCCWDNAYNKQHPLFHLTVYALSPPHQRVFYALASWCPSQRTRDYSKRRGLIACVQTTTPTANFWAQIILDPYRRPLTLTFLHVSTRGLFQNMMFEHLRQQHVFRGCFRSYSATASLRHKIIKYFIIYICIFSKFISFNFDNFFWITVISQ